MMQFGAVLAPIAAATIVNTALAWFAWQETLAAGRGNSSSPFEAGLGIYLVALAGTVYLLKDAQISTPLSLFGAAFASEAFGGLVLYGIGRAYQMRCEPWRNRALPTAAAVFFTVVIIAGVFTS